MVSSLEPDMSLFRMHTPDSIQGTMDFLQRQESLGKDKFLELQTAMGSISSRVKPDGLLAHAAYGPPVIECVMFDWLHIYLVNGIFNVLTGCFLETFTTMAGSMMSLIASQMVSYGLLVCEVLLLR